MKNKGLLSGAAALALSLLFRPGLSAAILEDSFSAAGAMAREAGARIKEAHESAPVPAAGRPTHGNVVFLWGYFRDEERGWIEVEKERFEPIAERLERNGFGVVYDTSATAADLRKFVEAPDTAVIIWSGHARGKSSVFFRSKKKGNPLDSQRRDLPYDVFQEASGNLKEVILATCDGKDVAKRYPHPASYLMHSDGIYGMTDLFDYLQNRWAKDLEVDFGVSFQ